MKAILRTAAVSAAGALRPGTLVDSDDEHCPLSLNDIKRYVAAGLAVEATEQATMLAAETATAVSGSAAKPAVKRASRKKTAKTTTTKEG